MFHVKRGDWMVFGDGGAVDSETLEEGCRRLAKDMDEKVPDGVGFGIFLFELGEAGSMAWISNANRSDMGSALAELLTRWTVSEKGVAAIHRVAIPPQMHAVADHLDPDVDWTMEGKRARRSAAEALRTIATIATAEREDRPSREG